MKLQKSSSILRVHWLSNFELLITLVSLPTNYFAYFGSTNSEPIYPH